MAMLLISGGMIGFNWMLLFEAYRYTSIAVATLCYYTAPVMLILASPLVFHEQFTWRQLVCVALAACGMVLVSGVLDGGTLPDGTLTGIALAIGSAVLYASITAVNRKTLSRMDAYDKTIVQLGAAGLVMVPYLALTGGFSDLYNTLIYGIEGEDYTKNADGTITTSYVGASPTADDSYGIQRWIIGSCKNALINNGTDPNYYADLEALEETARVNPFLNFTFDRTNVEGICASILNVYYEYGPQLDNGVAGDNWEELYNNYMAARKDAGIEELVTEFQNQLNAYIEANNITSW